MHEYDAEENYERMLHTFAVTSVATDPFLVEDVRKRLKWYYLNPATAAAVGVTFEALEAFAHGFKTLPRDALARLARKVELL